MDRAQIQCPNVNFSTHRTSFMADSCRQIKGYAEPILNTINRCSKSILKLDQYDHYIYPHPNFTIERCVTANARWYVYLCMFKRLMNMKLKVEVEMMRILTHIHLQNNQSHPRSSQPQFSFCFKTHSPLSLSGNLCLLATFFPNLNDPISLERQQRI